MSFYLLPVLRVWDVLLYEGNRVMLFRTALALMELYGTGLAISLVYEFVNFNKSIICKWFRYILRL